MREESQILPILLLQAMKVKKEDGVVGARKRNAAKAAVADEQKRRIRNIANEVVKGGTLLTVIPLKLILLRQRMIAVVRKGKSIMIASAGIAIAVEKEIEIQMVGTEKVIEMREEEMEVMTSIDTHITRVAEEEMNKKSNNNDRNG